MDPTTRPLGRSHFSITPTSTEASVAITQPSAIELFLTTQLASLTPPLDQVHWKITIPVEATQPSVILHSTTSLPAAATSQLALAPVPTFPQAIIISTSVTGVLLASRIRPASALRRRHKTHLSMAFTGRQSTLPPRWSWESMALENWERLPRLSGLRTIVNQWTKPVKPSWRSSR